jgi:cytochrome c biogenesis protein CcdA
MSLTLPIITTAALLDSINPCAISVLLLTLAFLFSLHKNQKDILLIAGWYIIGIFLTYVLIGLGVLSALTFFGIPQGLAKFGAVILIITGLLSIFELLIPNFPIHLRIPAFIKPELARRINKATLPAMFALGILVGLFEFPCTGGPYLLILTLLHDKSTLISGAIYLIYYNLIFVSPLVAILLIGSRPGLNIKIQSFRERYGKRADLISSSLLIILGLIIFLL